MLIQFSVKNYRSFRDKVTLSMVAAPIHSQDRSLDKNNVFEVSPMLKLLTSAAIYGANASGKSNLVLAIDFLRNYVLTGYPTGSLNGPVMLEPFLLNGLSENESSEFEAVFKIDAKIYRYGLRLNPMQVAEEWLFVSARARESKLFSRVGNRILLGRLFSEGKRLANKTRPNAPFLSVVAQFNGEIANSIVSWFKNMTLITEGTVYGGVSRDKLLVNRALSEEAVKLIANLDLGVEALSLEEVNVGFVPSFGNDSSFPELTNFATDNPTRWMRIVTHHRKSLPGGGAQVEKFDAGHHESAGTKKLIGLAGHLAHALRFGHLLIVDELDARLHPEMTKAIIRLFNSAESNLNHAQLIFTTHDTNLLDKSFLRRDQIWFTEKDSTGNSTLYSLVEYKVRNDASFEKDYLHGKYGAIPHLRGLRSSVNDVDG